MITKMRVLFDTDVLIARMIEKHANHEVAFPWLNKAAKKEIEGTISQHTIAEIYAVLTSFPIRPRISPNAAVRLIKENLNFFRIIEMSKDDYFKVLEHMAKSLCIGGSIYDGIIGYTGMKASVDILLTFNENHFKRIFPQFPGRIQKPACL